MVAVAIVVALVLAGVAGLVILCVSLYRIGRRHPEDLEWPPP
jgi:hypothetical protein